MLDIGPVGDLLFWLIPLLIAAPWAWLYRRARWTDVWLGLPVAAVISAATFAFVYIAPFESGSTSGIAVMYALVVHAFVIGGVVIATRWVRSRSS